MEIKEKLTEGIFLKRPNRFGALVEIEGREEYVYLPNPGRMKELLLPGRKVILIPKNRRAGGKRKTKYDLVLVFKGNILVSVDSRIPNKLVYRALKEKRVEEFANYSEIKPEVTFGDSRLDFLLKSHSPSLKEESYLLEVKSVTLVRKGRGLFPDAPTLRGTRHLHTLTIAKERGLRAGIIFVIQREDAHSFAPNDLLDPDFGKTLREAAAHGVETYAYTCVVGKTRIELNRQVPVGL